MLILASVTDLVKYFDGKKDLEDIEQGMEKVDEEFRKCFGVEWEG